MSSFLGIGLGLLLLLAGIAMYWRYNKLEHEQKDSGESYGIAVTVACMGVFLILLAIIYWN